MSGYQTWDNITLKDITIYDPVHSPGILMGNSSNPITNLVFDNVVVVNPGTVPFGDNYSCNDVMGVAVGKTSPVPNCFTVSA